jgi:hypothetical protein
VSARPALIVHAAAASQLLPPVLGVAAGRLSPVPRRWVVVWCLLQAASDGISLAVAYSGHGNLWVTSLFSPVSGAVALWTLSCWQRGATGRLALRFAIPLFLLVSAGLTLGVDDPRTYSLIAAPYHALVLCFAALWTFMTRSLAERGRLLRQDWFWVLGGIMLFTGTATALQPLSWYLLRVAREDLLVSAINVKSAVDVLAFAAITLGVLCPLPPRRSGGAFSPPSSPLASSSAPSASPSWWRSGAC